MSNSKCIVTATFTPLPGQFEEVKQLLLSVIPDVHLEPGCEFYTLNESVDGQLIFIEAWTTRRDWEIHNGFWTVAKVNEGVAGKLAVPVEVKEMYSLPAGQTEKGVL